MTFTESPSYSTSVLSLKDHDLSKGELEGKGMAPRDHDGRKASLFRQLHVHNVFDITHSFRPALNEYR
jgi:hypothetical protein